MKHLLQTLYSISFVSLLRVRVLTTISSSQHINITMTEEMPLSGMKIPSLIAPTTATDKTNGTTRTSSVSSKPKGKWSIPCNKIQSCNYVPTALSFKGAHVDLYGKLFIKGPLHAAKYDKAYKTILAYIGSNYDHYVYTAFKYKDTANGLGLLTKPSAP